MIPYGKMVQTAIAAVSRLAQVYDPARRVKLSSADIAESRRLPQPVVAKVLTLLSQIGLVAGAPGPKGGYWLARPPEQISLLDVAGPFQRNEEELTCPFGPDWCGNGPHCPLHAYLEMLRNQRTEFMKQMTFAAFMGWDQEKGCAPQGIPVVPPPSFSLPIMNTNVNASAKSETTANRNE